MGILPVKIYYGLRLYLLQRSHGYLAGMWAEYGNKVVKLSYIKSYHEDIVLKSNSSISYTISVVNNILNIPR